MEVRKRWSQKATTPGHARGGLKSRRLGYRASSTHPGSMAGAGIVDTHRTLYLSAWDIPCKQLRTNGPLHANASPPDRTFHPGSRPITSHSTDHTSFYILHSTFFILHSTFPILHSPPGPPTLSAAALTAFPGKHGWNSRRKPKRSSRICTLPPFASPKGGAKRRPRSKSRRLGYRASSTHGHADRLARADRGHPPHAVSERSETRRQPPRI